MKAASDNIIKYAKLISELPFSAGDATRIIFKSGGRCYMTARDAAFKALSENDIRDITDHDQSQIPAAAALMKSKNLNAMILCKPPYTGICIESRHEIPAVLDDMAQIVGPEVSIVEPDEKQISRALARSTSVMVENSCLIAGGRNLYEAYVAVQIIEKSAETILKAQVICGVRHIDPRLSRYMHYKYQHAYSKAEKDFQDAAEQSITEAPQNKRAIKGTTLFSLFGTQGEFREDGTVSYDAPQVSAEDAAKWGEHERELREQLVRYGNMLVSTGLVQGTWGNLSVMLDREYMLCTPSGIDYDRLTPADIVKVSISTLKWEGRCKPTSEKGMHAGIYKRYPDANAVIHTHSKYCSIFAAGEMPLQVESKEKMLELGEIISVSRYALAGTGGITRNAIKAIGAGPGCILSHHGMIAKGKDLEEAFRYVRLIEEAAEEYINRRLEK
jgi:L-fuculose-phosphate aldolase